MKIAIATFGSRVSPRLDCAPAFLVVTFADNRPVKREELVATGWATHERMGHLLKLGIDAVICGGIDWLSAETLCSQGVALYAGVTGEIEDAVTAFVRGELNSHSYHA